MGKVVEKGLGDVVGGRNDNKMNFTIFSLVKSCVHLVCASVRTNAYNLVYN